MNEPSFVAVNLRNGQILAVGHDAKGDAGKNAAPCSGDAPSSTRNNFDFEVTEKMLRFFFEKVHRESSALIPRPRVVVEFL